MKKLWILSAVAALSFASCAETEIVENKKSSNEISFTSATGKNLLYKAQELLDADFNDFKVWAWNTANNMSGSETMSVYITAGDITRAGGTSSDWSSANKYYWPSTGMLQFFAAKGDITMGTPATGYPSFTYTVKDVAAQEDLIAANAINQSKPNPATTPVNLPFKHILSQINFSLKGENSALTYKVTKIEVTNVKNGATFTFDGTTSIGAWSAQAGTVDYTYFTGTKDLNLGNTESFGDGTGTALMLMPQDAKDVIVKVTYSVYQGNVQLKASVTPKVTLAGQTWEKGKKIRYTLTLPTDNDGTGGLDEIKFSASVENWDSNEVTGDFTVAP